MPMDLIDRKDTIDAMENVDWYHQNRSMEMVHGANSDDQAWYKAEDVYEVLERMPSVQPETDLQSTCNEVATDCISRQMTVDEIGKRAERCAERFGTDDPFWEGLIIAKTIVECAPSAQPERKKGTWLPIIETNEFGEPYQAGVHCSRCGYATVYETSFCPDCGVYIGGEQE